MKALHTMYWSRPAWLSFFLNRKSFSFWGRRQRQTGREKFKASVWKSDISPQREVRPGSVSQVRRGIRNRPVSGDSEAFTPRGTSQRYVWKRLFSPQVRLSLNSFPSHPPRLSSGNCPRACYLRGESPLFKGAGRGSFPIWCHEATLRLKASLSRTSFTQRREKGRSSLFCGSGPSCGYWVGLAGSR